MGDSRERLHPLQTDRGGGTSAASPGAAENSNRNRVQSTDRMLELGRARVARIEWDRGLLDAIGVVQQRRDLCEARYPTMLA